MKHGIRRAVYAQTFPALSGAELAALRAFAHSNGRLWKARLAELWVKAKAEPVLHRLRNTHGPDWLRTIALTSPDENNNQAQDRNLSEGEEG